MELTQLFRNVFVAGPFIPHGHCYLWKPGLVWLHILSDSLIALAYYSIPIVLVYFVRQRKDLPFNWIFLLFGAFIVACGTTHIMEIWTLWHPTYWLSGFLKAITAWISIYTAVILVPLVPKALSLPSPAQLEKANRHLQEQITERKQAEEALQTLNEELEQRVEERTALLFQTNTQLRQEILTSQVAERNRQQAEVALRDSELQLQAILDNAKAVIYAKDKQGRYILVNRQFETLFHLNREQVNGKTDYDVFSRNNTNLFWQSDLQVLQSGVALELEEVFPVEEEARTYLAVKFPLQDSAGVPYAVCGISTDITDRKKVEIALQESEQRFRATFNQAAVGISQAQPDGRLISVNQKYCEILGYSQEELLMMSSQDVTHPDDLAQDLILLTRLLVDEIPMFSTERRYRRKNGDYIWVSLTVSIVRDLAGAPKYSIAVVEDINQRKKAESDIQQALQRERELSELKSQFITTVSHELRTPLTAIAASAELLEHQNYEPGNPKRTKHFNYIKSGVKRILQVLSDIFILKQLEVGDITHNPTSVDMMQCCHNIIADWQKTINSEHHILFTHPNETNLEAYLDVFLLRQALTQLLSNAVRYSPEGGDISIEVIHKDAFVTIRISDQGIGIPKAEQAEVFNKFYRASNANLIPGTPGAGLGLAIVKRAIFSYQGTIEIVSDVGKGATFIISIPLKYTSSNDTASSNGTVE